MVVYASKVVQVTNIAPQATKDQMQSLFGFLGKIEDIRLYPTIRDVSCPVQSRICYIRYTEASSSAIAQHMTNTVFIDRALIVIPVATGDIPDEYYALEMTRNGTIVPGLCPSEPKLPPNVVNSLSGTDHDQVILTSDPSLEEKGLPPYPPLPANYDSTKIEEIRRSVLLSNIPSNTTADEVITFFAPVGEVKHLRSCSRTSDNSFHWLVEFADQHNVAEAFSLTGVVLNGKPVKITHATQAITKPQAKSNEAAQREIEEAMSRVKEAQSLISAAIDPVIGMLSKDKTRCSSRRSRSRSGGSRRRRSRSRSRRSRSLHRNRSHSKRSRSRERKRRSRSHRRSRSRRRSRTPRRSRSRGYRRERRRSRDRSRDRHSRDRSRDKKSRDRKSKDRERERSKDRHVSRDRSKERVSRDKSKERRSRDRSKDRRSKSVEKLREKSTDRERKFKESRSSDTPPPPPTRSRDKTPVKERRSRDNSRDRKVAQDTSPEKRRKSRSRSRSHRRRLRSSSRERRSKRRSRSRERRSKRSNSRSSKERTRRDSRSRSRDKKRDEKKYRSTSKSKIVHNYTDDEKYVDSDTDKRQIESSTIVAENESSEKSDNMDISNSP